MATLIWTGIFAFLVGELILTLILVLPVPRRIRNYIAKKIFILQLGERLAKPILFIGIALGLALVESYLSHQRLLERLKEDHAMEVMAAAGGGANSIGLGVGAASITAVDLQRKYKSERNMYLAGFSLTLLFVIGRLTQLMEENVELEDECDRLHKSTIVKNGGGGAAVSTPGSGVEMPEIRKKPVDKKKD